MCTLLLMLKSGEHRAKKNRLFLEGDRVAKEL